MTTEMLDAGKFLRSLDSTPLTIGKILWAHRVGEEMTQKELSKLLGISIANLCDIEKGRKLVSPKRAARFAKALQLSEQLFIQLALEDILRRDGFKTMAVTITQAPAKKSHRKAA